MLKLTFFILVFLLCFPGISSPDTLLLKNGERVKGLILNEYKDRIVVSTAGGEVYYMKSDIRSASYDSEARSFLQAARNQVKKGQYVKAYYTYEQVTSLDPDIEEAAERLIFLSKYIGTKAKYDMKDRIARHRDMDTAAESVSPGEKIEKKLGILLARGDKYVEVKETDGVSSGLLAKGDKIVSVWGEMAAFMDIEEVASLLLGSNEVRITVERPVPVELSDINPLISLFLPDDCSRITGAKLKLERAGLTVSRANDNGPFKNAGIERGDLIFAVDGKSTEYMSLGTFRRIIRSRQGETTGFVIRRKIVLWSGE